MLHRRLSAEIKVAQNAVTEAAMFLGGPDLSRFILCFAFPMVSWPTTDPVCCGERIHHQVHSYSPSGQP